MRPLTRLLVFVAPVCIAIACGNTNNPGGSGSGGPPPDGGVVPDAGTPGGGSDAGTPGGGSDGGATPDAGGGGGGGGTDGGTASDCDRLAPGALPAMVTHQQTYSVASENRYCTGLPIGTGNGNVAFPAFPANHPDWNVLSPNGDSVGGFGAWTGSAWATPAGFIMYSGSSTQQMVVVKGLSSTGAEIGHTEVNGSAWFAADPNGGLLAVGSFNPGSAPTPPPPNRMIQMFNADGTSRWGPSALGTDEEVVGAGVDTLGRSVVILGAGSGNVDAIWFGADGKPATGVFRILTGFVPGPTSTWFETSPLIGGGLALRRMDAPADGDERRTSQWLSILPSGQAATQPAPDWLTGRPDTNMQIARSGRGYAFLPWTADKPTCDQQVEIVSPAGNSCGRADFPIDGNACRTRELRLGLDGTVMQMLPPDREQNQPSGSAVYTCTMRFWPAALK